jgi:serine/threonine-protein kinase RIO1
MMDTRLLDYTLKELFALTRKHKIEAIEMLIDSIRDDAVYEAESAHETEMEYNKLKNNK